jgi:hypothetical protein
MKRSLLVLLLSVLVLESVCVKAQRKDSTVEDAAEVSEASPLANEAILALSYQNGGLGFGILYKREKKKNRFFRLGVTNVGFSYYTDTPSPTSQYMYRISSFQGSVVIGYEFRFQVHPKVFTYTGIDAMAGLQRSTRIVDYGSSIIDNQSLETTIIQAGLVFNSGVQVRVHELIMLGINLSPNVFYANRRVVDSEEDESINDHGVEATFNSSFVQATVVFHWPKKKGK